MNILKVIMSLLVIAILMIGLSFAAFMVYENTIVKKDKDVSTNANEQHQTVEEDTSMNSEQSEEKPEYLPHLSDKNYAFGLMTLNRDALPEGSKEQKEYDGTIQTARTNIANGLGKNFDYKIVEQYEAIATAGGNQGKAKEYIKNHPYK
ncbi:hypothetical protein MUA23_09340 [Mammaliicoccus sciuri]|uniref:hypothetical protein n=1 Tax=Mammaliicoccus sciuri TaxID=1296 RepID=UPI0021D072D8|nr:hypothetical protein [Mammaliicoccus sciuri]UXU71031.1 hypothetical protein MUA23_09340 [Mammaliicoccus sciuri]